MSQTCPNCGAAHDVSVYVSGQRMLCRCGIRFEVVRADTSGVSPTGADRGRHSSVPARGDPARLSAADGAAAAKTPAGPDSTFVAKPVSVPGYELVELLGRGGMGEVWRARQTSLGREVAVKILSRDLASDPTFVARFEKEAAALAALSHPNIVQIIDRGVGDGVYFFAMELVEGISLREQMGGGRLSPSEALRIVAQVCRAIDYAHDRGVVHRDLKPENILLDPAGNVKVADFGLAGVAAAGGRLDVTRSATAMGTLHYMAPEQRRDARSVDGRADVYSLGVVLYELLTGEVPLGRFKLPSERVAGLDRRLDAIVARALEPDPAGRYARASLVSRDLEALIATEPAMPAEGAIVPHPAALAERLEESAARRPRRVRRRKMALGLVLVGAIAGAVATAAFFGGGRFPRRKLPPDTHADRPVRAVMETAAGRTRVAVTFEEGPGARFALHSGEWLLLDRSLVARAYDAGRDPTVRFLPRAYLLTPRFFAGGLSAEVTAEVDVKPPWRGYTEPVTVELLFKPRGGHLGVRALFGPPPRRTGSYLVGWTYRDAAGDRQWGSSAPGAIDRDEEGAEAFDLDEDEAIHLPVPRRPFRLRLVVGADDRIEAFVDGLSLFARRLPDVSKLEGRIGLECRNAACRFADLVVEGRASGAEAPARGVHPPGHAAPPEGRDD